MFLTTGYEVEIAARMAAVACGNGCRCGASRKERPEEATLLLL